jgi:hypothetical protein
MLLTRGFRETVEARADREPAFRAGLYQAATQALLDGDLGAANILLRDVIHATMGFGELGRRVDIPDKSLMRMFEPAGTRGRKTGWRLCRRSGRNVRYR